VRFTTALLAQGVRALERGAWFLSTAHTSEVVGTTLVAIAAALDVLAGDTGWPRAVAKVEAS
jgi:glutamate-1-semialdehyde 2,1-aminomutase